MPPASGLPPVTSCYGDIYTTRATTVPGEATAWLAGVTTTAGMPVAPPYPGGYGYGQPGYG